MNPEYASYLQSEAWRARRHQRLAISHYRCAACPAQKAVDVHHLTYKHIFNEPMEDLLPLCREHHETAEALVKQGRLPRTDDVLFLATETVRLLVATKQRKTAEKRKPTNSACEWAGISVKIRNPWQEKLMAEPEFRIGLGYSPRKTFKRWVKKYMRSRPQKHMLLANAFTLYDRIHR